MKRLAIFGIAAIVAVSVSSQLGEGEIQKKTAQITASQTGGHNTDQSGQNPPSVIVQVSAPPASNSEDKKENDYHLAVYTGLLAAFTGALVFVGIGQFCMMGQHKKGLDGLLGAIKRQSELMSRNNVITLATARSAQESAKAANAQIQTVKDKERARWKSCLMILSLIRLSISSFCKRLIGA